MLIFYPSLFFIQCRISCDKLRPIPFGDPTGGELDIVATMALCIEKN